MSMQTARQAKNISSENSNTSGVPLVCLIKVLSPTIQFTSSQSASLQQCQPASFKKWRIILKHTKQERKSQRDLKFLLRNKGNVRTHKFLNLKYNTNPKMFIRSSSSWQHAQFFSCKLLVEGRAYSTYRKLTIQKNSPFTEKNISANSKKEDTK